MGSRGSSSKQQEAGRSEGAREGFLHRHHFPAQITFNFYQICTLSHITYNTNVCLK